MDYARYIRSELWRKRRRRALRRAGSRCQYEIGHDTPGAVLVRCPEKRHLSVHHLTYVRLGNELDSDLEALCYVHHQTEHLMYRLCAACKLPFLGTYANAERRLREELTNRGIRDPGCRKWFKLPNKEGLWTALSLDRPCWHCGAFRTAKG